MRTIFSTATAGVPPAEAFDHWLDSVSTWYPVRYEAAPLDRQHHFDAELRMGVLGDLTIATMRAAPMISRSAGSDELALLLPMGHTMVGFAGGYSLEVERGKLYLFDARQPHDTISREPFGRLAVVVPREALSRRIPLDKGLNWPIPREGDAELLEGYVRELVRIGPSRLSPAAAALERQHIIDLVAAMFGSLIGVTN